MADMEEMIKEEISRIGGLKERVVNPEKCIKCGMSMARCKFKAILVC